jgi:hypothetical protein
MARKSASGSGMNNPDHIFYSLETLFWGLKYIKYLNSGIRDGDSSDPGSGMEKSRIRDKHSGSATLKKNDEEYIYCRFNLKGLCHEMNNILEGPRSQISNLCIYADGL